MVYSTSVGSVKASTDLVDAAKTAASSEFLGKNGHYIGGALSVLWTIISFISIYFIKSIDKTKVPNKNYFWIGPIVGLLLVLIANGYYFGLTSKPKDEKELNEINSVYANISLIPIYLIIIAFVILLVIR